MTSPHAVIPRRYLSEIELEQLAGISRRTLQSWRLRNQGPRYRKLGGAVRYDLQAFHTWVAQQPGGGGAE